MSILWSWKRWNKILESGSLSSTFMWKSSNIVRYLRMTLRLKFLPRKIYNIFWIGHVLPSNISLDIQEKLVSIFFFSFATKLFLIFTKILWNNNWTCHNAFHIVHFFFFLMDRKGLRNKERKRERERKKILHNCPLETH